MIYVYRLVSVEGQVIKACFETVNERKSWTVKTIQNEIHWNTIVLSNILQYQLVQKSIHQELMFPCPLRSYSTNQPCCYHPRSQRPHYLDLFWLVGQGNFAKPWVHLILDLPILLNTPWLWSFHHIDMCVILCVIIIHFSLVHVQ